MGQAGSQPSGADRTRRALTLPHEPLRHAPKVLPSLTASPRLRSTDNGAILQSGGTISGRRPGPEPRVPHGHVHSNVFRSRSAGGAGEPLQRSHTNLDIRHGDGSGLNKRFGSEPDLRIEEEQKKKSNTRHFRKKYRAPQPPAGNRDGLSPDSRGNNTKTEPNKKLRLFRTRNETKQMNGNIDMKTPVYKSFNNFKSLETTEQLERRYKSLNKGKETHLQYPDNRDMIQSTASLKREERLFQARQDYKNARLDRAGAQKSKIPRAIEHTEAWKTPHISKNFRYSERFRKDENDSPVLRREKTFDSLFFNESRNNSPNSICDSKNIFGNPKAISPLGDRNQPLRKSLPSLLTKSNEVKDEFQIELKKATNKVKNELGDTHRLSDTKTSQHDKLHKTPTKNDFHSKVRESSLKLDNNTKQESKVISVNMRKPLSRLNDSKMKASPQSRVNSENSKKITYDKENGTLHDRGQASGKESTPEHSPTTRQKLSQNNANDRQKAAPSKQFYFGMIENKQPEPNDRLKDFPGLGTPIIEEFNNFHLIEKKLLGYHDEDEMEKFNEKLKVGCKRNLSSESALSSDGSEGEGSDNSLGIALRLRPTMPKKLPNAPHFSPAAAWRQLASLDAQLAETQALAVITKLMGDNISAESSPRSDQSADKSGDSGISGDHGHSDHRLDSPRDIPDTAAWTPQQDLGDSSSDGVGGAHDIHGTVATYSPGVQPFSLSLPRDHQDKSKQLQQGFNSLQKLRKSVSGALGVALGSRRFDLEHEPMLEEPQQNWFLTKSAPNSLSNPLLYHQPLRNKNSLTDEKEETSLPNGKEPDDRWRGTSYMSWGGHVMYLPPAPAAPTTPDQPLSIMGTFERPVRSKSSGCLEVAARAARSALAGEMRERERSASPDLARAVPARVEPVPTRTNIRQGKRFTFQSTVRQLERRRLAERLSREADLKEQQRKTELEAMRRVEEEFQRKRAREKANIRQQLRLVSSGANSMQSPTTNSKSRDEPDGSCRASPAPERSRDARQRHSNASSDISARSKSSTPIRGVELSEWRDSSARVYRDWGAPPALAHDHPPACARMPMTTHHAYNGTEGSFSGSPRSDNYRAEWARGRSLTPRAPRLLPARSPASSTSGSELSLRPTHRALHVSEPETKEEEPAIVPTLRPTGPTRTTLAMH